MKIALEMNAALRYKLRMMGVPIEGASNTFGDNASVIKNVTLPESTLHKRHNSIANHKCCEELREGRRVLRMNSGRNCSKWSTLMQRMLRMNPASFARSVLH